MGFTKASCNCVPTYLNKFICSFFKQLCAQVTYSQGGNVLGQAACSYDFTTVYKTNENVNCIVTNHLHRLFYHSLEQNQAFLSWSWSSSYWHHDYFTWINKQEWSRKKCWNSFRLAAGGCYLLPQTLWLLCVKSIKKANGLFMYIACSVQGMIRDWSFLEVISRGQ